MGIGKRIKEARQNKGLTQEALAMMIGVTKGAVANYEKDTSHPKEPIIYALMDVLEVEPNFLFQDCVNVLKGKKKEPLELVELKDIYISKLNSEGRRRLMSHARFLTTEPDCVTQTPPKSKTG